MIELTTETILGLILTTILGMGWGSFATMASYRLPRDETWIGLKPRCLLCAHELRFKDFAPIFSWFYSNGTCNYCGKTYQRRFSYLYIEIATTVLFIWCYIAFNFGQMYILVSALCICTILISSIEVEHQKIPSKILLSSLILGMTYRTLIDGNIWGIIYGAPIGALLALSARHIYYYFHKQPQIARDWLVYKKEDRFKGPGFDYVKLMAISGICLPLSSLLLVAGITLASAIIFRLLKSETPLISTVISFGTLFFILYS